LESSPFSIGRSGNLSKGNRRNGPGGSFDTVDGIKVEAIGAMALEALFEKDHDTVNGIKMRDVAAMYEDSHRASSFRGVTKMRIATAMRIFTYA